MDIYRLCDFNPGFLVPWFFPKFLKGEPLSLNNRPFAYALMSLITHGYLAVRGARQIAKSSSLVVRQKINQVMLPNWKSLYIAPHPVQATTYANKMLEMRHMFRFYRRDHRLKQNMYYDSWHNGSTIEITNVLTSAAHIHGKTADEVAFDEYQFFDPSHEQEILAVQASRDLKVRLYTGTAFTLDSPLEERYQSSSQGRWQVRSGDGRSWLDMGDKETLLACMAPDGPRCPKTRRLLNMRDGLFVHAYESKIRDRKIGLHIPRIIIPDFASDILQWQEIWNLFESGDMPAFLKNACGIPVESGVREITEQDLKNICVLGPQREMMDRVVKKRLYRRIISGSDWGGTEFDPVAKIKTSFSVHVILGESFDGYIDILHIRQYSGQDYLTVAHQMARDHERFGGYAYGSDAGAGMAYNNELRKLINPSRHLVFNLLGPNTAPLAISKGSQYVGLYNLNKTEAMTALLTDLKSGKIRCYDWPDAAPRLLEFLNSFRVPTESSLGRRYFVYHRKSSASDDTLMACLFGHAMLRIARGDRLLEDAAQQAALARHLSGQQDGFVPRQGGSRLFAG